MTEQMAKLAFDALDRLLEAYVDKSSPFHSPVSRDAQMALRELRHHFRYFLASNSEELCQPTQQETEG